MLSRVSAGKPNLIQFSAKASYNQEILSVRIFGVGYKLQGAIQWKRSNNDMQYNRKIYIPASWLPTAE
jgi:hypothetical protein